MTTILFYSVFFSTVVLLGGQYPVLSVFIAVPTVMLWYQLLRKHWFPVVRSPVFYAWLAFLALLAVRFFNQGAVGEYDGGMEIMQPSSLTLPFLLFPNRAVMQLISFSAVAAMCVTISVDSIAWEDLPIRLAVVLAILGVVQYHTRAPGFGWMLIPYKSAFFSVFPYVNNAGTFFFLAAGLALHRSWKNLPWFALFAYCTYLTHTRFVWAGFVVLLGAKIVTSAFRRDRDLRYGLRLCCGTAACILFYLMADELFRCRWHEYGINFEILTRFPWFGVGPSGQTVMNWVAAPEWLHSTITANPNTHCDYLVFAVEHGVAGFLLLVFIAFCMLRGRLSHLTRVDGLAICYVGAHACFDMPLRSAAVLAMIVVMLAFMEKKSCNTPELWYASSKYKTPGG